MDCFLAFVFLTALICILHGSMVGKHVKIGLNIFMLRSIFIGYVLHFTNRYWKQVGVTLLTEMWRKCYRLQINCMSGNWAKAYNCNQNTLVNLNFENQNFSSNIATTVNANLFGSNALDYSLANGCGVGMQDWHLIKRSHNGVLIQYVLVRF